MTNFEDKLNDFFDESEFLRALIFEASRNSPITVNFKDVADHLNSELTMDVSLCRETFDMTIG